MVRAVPDTHNGQKILRPVTHGGDGIPKLASSSVFHPPTVSVVYPLEALVEDETRAIIGMKAMTTSELRVRLYAFAKQVIANEKARNPNG